MTDTARESVPGFISRDYHAKALCQHLSDMGAAEATIPLEWEGATYEVSVVAQGLGGKLRAEIETEQDRLQALLQGTQKENQALLERAEALENHLASSAQILRERAEALEEGEYL